MTKFREATLKKIDKNKLEELAYEGYSVNRLASKFGLSCNNQLQKYINQFTPHLNPIFKNNAKMCQSHQYPKGLK